MDGDDLVLVALINNPRDLEIVRAERWYRIPAKHAPAHVTQARYVAFYLTKPFGEYKWTIREYAPVRGHELVRRRDLFPDQATHPRADEAYYQLQLGALIELARPIVSRSGRRILFIWTTGEKFSRAVEINDLLGKNDADDALWGALKASGIGAERQMMVARCARKVPSRFLDSVRAGQYRRDTRRCAAPNAQGKKLACDSILDNSKRRRLRASNSKNDAGIGRNKIQGGVEIHEHSH